MKAKVFLGLSVCCFLVSIGLLVGLAVSRGVEAQGNMYPPNSGFPGQMTVKFGEDFMRQHGRQTVSIYKENLGGWTDVYTVPEGKRLIITDICVEEDTIVQLASNTGGDDINEFSVRLWGASGLHVHLISGIVFEPGETIRGHLTNWSKAAFTGYFVDV